MKRVLSTTLALTKVAWRTSPLIVTATFAVTALQAGIPAAVASLNKHLFDLLAAIGSGRSQEERTVRLVILLAGLASLGVIGHMVAPVARFLDKELGRRVGVTMRSQLFNKTTRFAGIEHFESPRFHDALHLAGQVARHGGSEVVHTLIGLARSTITSLVFTLVLLRYSWLLAVLVLLGALPELLARLSFGSARVSLIGRLTPLERRLMYLAYVLTGGPFAKELRLFAHGGYLLHRLLATHSQVNESERAQDQREFGRELPLGVLSSVIAGVALALVAFSALAVQLSIGDVALYVSAVLSMQGSLSGMVSGASRLNELSLGYMRYEEILGLPDAILIPSRPVPVPELTSGIKICEVSFRYSEETPWVLRKFSLTIPAQGILALVGPNGAGKTTLIKLLTRLYDPAEGAILWDGIDIREFDPWELRRHISPILQDFVRYELSAHENIGIGDVGRIHDHARVSQAAIHAGVHDTISRLPQGYDTVLSHWLAEESRDAELSGGEWQKVALARMLMRAGEVVILDEPTSSLDARAEYELHERIRALTLRRACLIISHRFSTVRTADLIGVVEDGRVTELGTHRQLQAMGGTYARLYELQAAQYQP